MSLRDTFNSNEHFKFSLTGSCDAVAAAA